MIANSTYCESEEDCTSYQTTCCSAAINRFHKLFQKEYDMICAVVCPQTITKCEDNKCVLEELEENPNP